MRPTWGHCCPSPLWGAGSQLPQEWGKARALVPGDPQMNSCISLKAEPGRSCFQVAWGMD